MMAVNLINIFSGGLSLVNAIPLARALLVDRILGPSPSLSGFPAVIEDAQEWMAHLGTSPHRWRG